MQQENFNRIQELERQMDEIAYDRRNYNKVNEIAFENETFQGNLADKRNLEESQSQISALKLKLKETEIKNTELEEKIKKNSLKLEENTKNFTNLQQKNEFLQQENNDLLQQLEMLKDTTYSIEREYDEKLFNIEKVIYNIFYKITYHF